MNLRGSLLVATTDGRILRWRDGVVNPVTRFDPRAGIRILLDAESRYAVLIGGTCSDGAKSVRVFDSRVGRVGRTTPVPRFADFPP